jgi:YtcA family
MAFPPTPGRRLALCIASAMTLAGCDPVINIAGANFPAWLFCAICGAVLAVAIRPVFVVTRVENYLWPVPIVYLSLAVLMGCMVYLIFFNRV